MCRYKAEFTNTKLKADHILGKNKAVMRVGFLEGWDLFNIIPSMMKEYKALYPDSDVIINCCGVKELATGLLTDSLDIVVTMKNSVMMYSEFECSDVAEVGKILIYSARHPLAAKNREDLTLRDFCDDTFLAPWEIVDRMIVEAVSNYTRPYGFIPNLRFVKNHESTITCVRNNMGVTIADEWVWAKDAEDLEWIPFNAKDTISIARLKTREDEHVMEMESILKKVIEKQEKTRLESL